MKTKLIGTLAIFGLFVFSCSEDQKATVAVMQKKATEALIEQVGKADVALELYKRELATRKENWVRLKTLCISYERRAKEAKKDAEKYRKEGKENLALLKEQESERFASRVALFKEREGKVEDAFKKFRIDYEEKKVELQILKDEVAALKAMGGLSEDLCSDNSESRLMRAKELEESIKQDCDRAQALIDVNMSDF